MTVGSRPLNVWTLSNGLSLLRLFLAIPVVLLAADAGANRWWIVAVCFAAYVTDLTDGYVARHFGKESDFGRIIDPVADKVYVAAFAISLAWQGLLPVWFLLFVAGRDALILAAGLYLKRKKGVLAQSNMTGKVAVVTVGVVLLLSLFRGDTGDGVFAAALVVSAVALSASLWKYARGFIARFRRQERGTKQDHTQSEK